MTLDSFLMILALAAATYATRFGGHIILSRFGALHPRVEAGLDAVPGAVIAALVAPTIVSGGPAEWVAAGVAILACMRFSMIVAVALALLTLVVVRQVV